jgi:hypothetical protein
MNTGCWDFCYNELAQYCVHWQSLMSEVFFLFCSATNSTCYHIKLRKKLPYILESNPLPFYSFRGLKNQMWIRFAVESWILEKQWSRCMCHKNNKIQ